MCITADRALRDGKKIFLSETFTGTSPYQTYWQALELQKLMGDGPALKNSQGEKIGTKCSESHGGYGRDAQNEGSIPQGRY